MKKHFLLLLMAFVSLAGWAAPEQTNIAIMPANLQYTYNEDVYPTEMGDATAEMVSVIGALPGEVTMADVVGALTFQPRAEITGTGTYKYGLILKEGYNEEGNLAGYTITISGGDGQIVILGKMLNADMIAAIPAVTFNGSKFTPQPVVSYPDPDDGTKTITLVAGRDFNYSYGTNDDNIHVGENAGIVKITAIDGSNYSGTATKNFTINPLELASVAVGAVANQTYNYGTPITPALTVTGTDAAGNTFPLRPADYTVDYGEEAAATNINAGTATGQLDAAADGDFTFAADANVADATFTILPKNLGDDDITFAEIPAVNYDGSEKEPEVTVKWTIGNGEGAVANNITENLTISYANNIVVGKGTVTAVPKENANPQNYTGSKTTSFDILPTSIAGATIAFKKNTAEAGADPVWENATYQYEGRDIEPGTNEEDGKLVVTLGGIELTQDVDFEIVEYANNKNASTEALATVTIQGIGNYARVDGTGDPITAIGEFEISKRTLTLTAANVTTTKGISPTLTSTNNIVDGEDLGGVITYTVYDGTLEAADNVVAPDAETTDKYTALAVGENRYTYKASWAANPLPEDGDDEDNLPDFPEGKTAADYDTEAQVAARANYNLEVIDQVAGNITVAQASLRIVPQPVTVKYGSEEQRLTYKVYNGTTEVAIANVGFTKEPVLEREAGTDVGEYTISVTNQVESEEAGAEAPVAAGDYVFTFETAIYNIIPFPIAIVANDQTVPYGVEPNLSTAPDAMVKAVDEDGLEVIGNKVTVTFTPAMTGNETVVTATLLGLELNLSDDYDGSVGTHTGAIIPTITNTNFEPLITNGSIIVKENPGLGLTLDPASEELKETIAEAENSGQSYIVSFGEMKMNAKEWYAMVLPFETTPAEIVGALGKYVVVNLLRSSEMKEEGEDRQVDAKFSLEWEKIPAGTPFLIKANTDTDWADAVFFGADLVEAITPTVTDFATFNGTYETGKSVKWGYELDGTTANADAKYRWLAHKEYKGDNNWKNPKSSKHDLAPMEAYLILDKAATKARIFVEDIDENGTTAIKSISAEEIHGLTVDGMYNLQGVKLQSAPTQKGVYINNGKKLIVK